ncbi:hypothetical protein [Paenibacillus sp. FSL H8-0079]|uniref:hypothetical protein n=1 Tax=Paenibacillus sp. FSL H8-0079 TaxID=2921375 RepID=UPI0030ECBADC
MIDLTSDMQFTTLIQTNALPTDCITFIHDYMHQLRNAHEEEAFPSPGQWYFILETTDRSLPSNSTELPSPVRRVRITPNTSNNTLVTINTLS